MSVTLACTWRPHGEMPRFQRLFSQLREAYAALVIAVPGEVDPADLDAVRALERHDGVLVVAPPDRTQTRHAAIRTALQTQATHVHYVDMDRLLRWVETRPDAWQKIVAAVQTTDCLIIGRSETDFRTHPQSLQLTETIVNTVFSHLLGMAVDLCSGTKGFSRRAAQFLVDHTSPGQWADAEWPMLLHRAGFKIDAVTADGLDWETADRHQAQAADAETQRRLADLYDRNPNSWAFRTQIALDIVREGLDTSRREMA